MKIRKMFLLLISIRSLFRRNNKIVSLIDHLIHFYVKNSIVSIHYAEWFNLCLHDKVCSCGTSWFLQFYFLRDVHSQFCAFKFCCNKRGRNDYIFCNDIVACHGWFIRVQAIQELDKFFLGIINLATETVLLDSAK